jgi:hypothetical protein
MVENAFKKMADDALKSATQGDGTFAWDDFLVQSGAAARDRVYKDFMSLEQSNGRQPVIAMAGEVRIRSEAELAKFRAQGAEIITPRQYVEQNEFWRSEITRANDTIQQTAKWMLGITTDGKPTPEPPNFRSKSWFSPAEPNFTSTHGLACVVGLPVCSTDVSGKGK